MAGAPHKCLPVTRCSLGRGAGLVMLVPNFPPGALPSPMHPQARDICCCAGDIHLWHLREAGGPNALGQSPRVTCKVEKAWETLHTRGHFDCSCCPISNKEEPGICLSRTAASELQN